MMDFSYKLLNYLIQGTAADVTKEAICRWQESNPCGGEFLTTVHDEVNIQAPKAEWRSAMNALKVAMESIEIDIPMLSDGFVGKSWHDIKATT
jgi:DNA polymerase I-like protein with 3'-5' exonuclease and polymerase domains